MATKVGEGYVEIRPDATGLFASLKRLAGPIAATLGGLAIGKALFVDPIKSAADFQTKLNVLAAQTGATKTEMQALSDTAMRLGADVKLPGTSAQDAADAMNELAKGGFSVKEAIAAVRPVLVASTAAQISNAEAAVLVSDSLHAFALGAGEAATVADLLAASANATTADMPEMGAALQQVGAQAHNLKIPIQDTVTALSELANAGIKGSDAGTSLKTFLQRLVPVTVKAKEAYKDLGINVFDANGEFIGMGPAIDQLRGGLEGLTQKQRQQALSTIFGSDAIRAASILTSGAAGKFDKMREAVTKQGAAQALATAQSKGLGGAFSGLQSTVETLQLKIGTALAPTIESLVRWFTSILPGALNVTMGVFSALGVIVSSVAGFLKEHENVLTILLSVIAAGTVAWLAYTAVNAAAAGVIALVTAAQTALNIVMNLNPIGIVVVAVAALVGILFVLYQRNETVRAAIQGTFAFLRTYVPAAIAVAKNAITTGINALRDFWNSNKEVRDVVLASWNAIKTIITTQIAIAKAVVLAVMAALRGDWGEAWDQISKVPGLALKGAISIIKGLGGAFLNAALTIGEKIVQGIVDGLGGLLDAVKNKVEEGLTGALDSINPFSPIEEGAARLIGEPIVAGTLMGVDSLAARLRGSLEGALRGALPAAAGTAGGLSLPAGGGAAGGLAAPGGIVVQGDLIVHPADYASFVSDLAETVRQARR